MANYSVLKQAIQDVVKTNGNNEITGSLLQQALLTMISSLGGYQFVGVANPSTNPGTPDQNVFYIAGAGSYPNFNNTIIPYGQLGILKYNGNWTVESTAVSSVGFDVSNSSVFNSFFKEIYFVGVQIENVNFVSIAYSAGTSFSMTLYNSSNAAIVTFQNIALNEYVMQRSSDGTAVVFGIIDTTKITVASQSRLQLLFNQQKVGNLSANPILVDKITTANKVVIKPSYTQTFSKRISTGGVIVNANASWFYSSPIELFPGDVVLLVCSGSANVIPIAITDEEATQYEAAVVYAGVDPSAYSLIADKQMFIAISAPNDSYFTFCLFRDNYISELLKKTESRISQLESEIVDLKNVDSDSGIDVNAVNYGVKFPKVIAGANTKTLDNWGTGNGAILSIENKYNNITRRNRKCVRVLSNSGNGQAWYNLSTTVNCRQNPILFELCIGDENNVTDNIPGQVAIHLYSGTQRTSQYRASYIVQSSGAQVYYRNGWVMLCLNFDSMTSRQSTGENFDITAVTAVGIMAYNTLNVPYSVYVARFDIVEPMIKPGIVTIIDNFGVSVPAMADYANEKGVRLNLSIIPGYYEGIPGAPICASRSELDRVAAQGHCIWNHTWTHARMNNLTFAEIQDQINLSEQWMEQNGFGKDCELISIPSAEFNTASANAVFASNAKMIFHNWNYNYNAQAVHYPYYPTLRCLPQTILDSTAVGSGLSGSDIGNVAARCMTYNGITIIGFHGTYWEIDNGESWKEYIDTISAISGVYHYGLDEIITGRWC